VNIGWTHRMLVGELQGFGRFLICEVLVS
jgi:hypothetical protein